MSDHWTDRLSEYLDGELAATELQELQAHLAECEECAEALAQLRRVVERAKSLGDRPPAADLWSGIAGRIGAAPAGGEVTDIDEYRERQVADLGVRRFSFSLPQLAAASVALMVLSGGSAYLATRAAAPEQQPAIVEAPAVAEPAASLISTQYEAAIAELERTLLSNREQLDTATVRVIEENLWIIDRAIAQAQRAIAQDPASAYLHEHLAVTMRQKLEFLRQAARMAGAVS
jgi:anti-sigma factor RsiW